MIRIMLFVVAAISSTVCLQVSAAAPDPSVSVLLREVAAERSEHVIHFQCEVKLENGTGRDLNVRSNFHSAFDGFEIVVTDLEGRVLVQREYTFHQSPFTPLSREFALKQGLTAATLIFPIENLPENDQSFKVRLVGTLPGSGYERILSSETLNVEVKQPPR